MQQLSWAKFVDVNVLQRQRRTADTLQGNSLVNVGHILAVSSCKGGVGKSTVAVNLACELQRRGLRVGLLDADIYGPSLPLMVQPIDHAVKKSLHNSKWIQPLECTNGLKVMSFGYVNPRSGAPGAGGKGPAVMRGPIATRVINQLVCTLTRFHNIELLYNYSFSHWLVCLFTLTQVGATEWGDLDYLLVDMPPGTGDIQITLSQAMSFTGAIIVTTPHELSLADATKGVAMFEVLKVPTLAVVENMSYFECDHGTRYYPFGRGGRQGLLQALNHATSYESEMNQSSGSGCGSSSSSSSGSSSNTKTSSSNTGFGELYERLKVCPLHCLPLSSDVSGSSGVANGHSDSNLSIDNTHSNTIQRTPNNNDIRVPAVMRLPNGSPISKIYASLADDVIIEIVKMQLNAQTIPSMTFIEGRGVIMRYYTTSQAIQYVIPGMIPSPPLPSPTLLSYDIFPSDAIHFGIYNNNPLGWPLSSPLTTVVTMNSF